MKKTFWVTLRNVPLPTILEAERWIIDRDMSFKYNQARISDPKGEGAHRAYVSYSFTNDDDAMLFKLTFSNYL
jgi:hypothetical protein